MLVHQRIGPGRRICVGFHIIIELLCGGRHLPLPQRLVIHKQHGFVVNRHQVLLSLVGCGLYGHGNQIRFLFRADQVSHRLQDSHFRKASQRIMGEQIHIGAVFRIRPIQPDLTAHIAFLFKLQRDIISRKRFIHHIRKRIHHRFIVVMPCGEGDRPARLLLPGRLFL